MRNINWSSIIYWSISILTIELLPGLGSFALEFLACAVLRFSLGAVCSWLFSQEVAAIERELAARRPVPPLNTDG